MAARTSRSETILQMQTNMRFESPRFRAVAISVRLPFLILILNIIFGGRAQALIARTRRIRRRLRLGFPRDGALDQRSAV